MAQVKTLTYNRRVPFEKYGHEEFTIDVSFVETDKLESVIKAVQSVVEKVALANNCSAGMQINNGAEHAAK